MSGFLGLLLIIVIGVGAHLHARARARARGDTLDAWCSPRGWRRETDREVARDVARRVVRRRDGSADHVVVGTTPDGREAVAVGWVSQTTVGSGDSEQTRRPDELHVSVRVRSHHPELRIGPAQWWNLGRDAERVEVTGHPGLDRRYRMVADDGAHAAAIAPWDALGYLAGDPTTTCWRLEGEWLTCTRTGPLEPVGLEHLLRFACWLAGRADTVPVGQLTPAGGDQRNSVESRRSNPQRS